ncbi:tachykinin-like peptides receptor 86C isoform X2 [Apostichopus japonicus]
MTATIKDLNVAAFAMLAVLSALAFIGNAIIITIIATCKQIRKGSRTVLVLVFNLAVSDLIFAGLSVPLTLASTTNKLDWSLGDIGCKLVMFLPNFCVAVTIFTLCVIAYDRRIAINNMATATERKGPGVLIITSSIWILGFVVSAPTFYEYSVYTKTVVTGAESGSSSEEVDIEMNSTVNVTSHRACGSHDIVESFEKVYATLLTLFIYILPLIFILCNYILIFRYIWKREMELNKTRNESRQNKRVMSSNTSRVLKMLIAVIAIFTIAWAPYFFLFFREEVTGSDDTANFGSTLHIIKLYTAILSSVMNPLVYGLFNSHIKRGFYALVCCSAGKLTSNSVAPITNP